MAAIPFMPLYVADYMSDAAHLSTLEHGAYLLLIMTYWQRGEKLPNDDKKLARICRLGPREWARIKPSISEFFEVDCSSWSHSRIERELANVRAKSLNKRKGGLARAKQMHSNRSAPAQQSDTDTDTGVSVAKATGADAPVDPVKLMFDSGVELITSAGKPERTARSWLAKARKDFGTEAVIVAIGRAKREGAIDPIPFMEGTLRHHTRNVAHEFTGPC
jgi:uncharacterized protein YdaU (DUF1376 family)